LNQLKYDNDFSSLACNLISNCGDARTVAWLTRLTPPVAADLGVANGATAGAATGCNKRRSASILGITAVNSKLIDGDDNYRPVGMNARLNAKGELPTCKK
jgi:hypothetical protein